jgi:hypothetical protein
LAVICALPLFGVGHAFGGPKRKRVKAGRAYHQQLLQCDPYGGAKFNVSTNPACYDQGLSPEQAGACAHRIARDLSVDFLGLTVVVTEGLEDKQVPRRIGIGKDSWPCVKQKDEPLDSDEQRFWLTFQKLKIKSSFEAKEDGLPDPDKEARQYPPNGTQRPVADVYGAYEELTNEVHYHKGNLFVNRKWVSVGGGLKME